MLCACEVKFYTFAFLILIPVIHSAGDLREYCQWENFEAECAPDEVVVITSALYGRMKRGRCIKLDRDDVGCTADVRGLADARCSGRQKCQIPIPDKLFDATMPCQEDLKLYLMASYQCLKVLQPHKNSCTNQIAENSVDLGSNILLQQHKQHLQNTNNNHFDTKNDNSTARSGYISSWISSKTGCGSPQTPWIIGFSPGQKINLTLIDFVAISQNSTYPKQTTSNVAKGLHSPCQVIAVIKEITPGKSVTVCSDADQKEKVIYVSDGHQLEVRLIVPKIAHDGGHFLIKYEAVGCQDVIPMERSWWLRSRTDPSLSSFGCKDSKKTWNLMCQNNRWVGSLPRDCPGSGSFFQAISNVDFFVPNFAAIMVVVCIAFLVGAVIFLAGLCYIRKQRKLLQSKKTQLMQERCGETYACKSEKLSQDFAQTRTQFQSACQPTPADSAYDITEENDYAYVDELLQIHATTHRQQPQPTQQLNLQQAPLPSLSSLKSTSVPLAVLPKPLMQADAQRQYQQQYQQPQQQYQQPQQQYQQPQQQFQQPQQQYQQYQQNNSVMAAYVKQQQEINESVHNNNSNKKDFIPACTNLKKC